MVRFPASRIIIEKSLQMMNHAYVACRLGHYAIALPLPERFWRHVDKTPGQGPQGECWTWTGSKSPQGYGRFLYERKVVHAHRIAWFLEYGHFPAEDVCHTCDNPPCVRLEHLFRGTAADNMKDARQKGRLKTKLSIEQVALIRSVEHPALPLRRSWAKQFGVSEKTIRKIVARRTWQ